MFVARQNNGCSAGQGAFELGVNPGIIEKWPEPKPGFDQLSASTQSIQEGVDLVWPDPGCITRIPGRFSTLSYSRTTFAETANETSPVNIPRSTVCDAPLRERRALRTMFASATIISVDIKCDIGRRASPRFRRPGYDSIASISTRLAPARCSTRSLAPASATPTCRPSRTCVCVKVPTIPGERGRSNSLMFNELVGVRQLPLIKCHSFAIFAEFWTLGARVDPTAKTNFSMRWIGWSPS